VFCSCLERFDLVSLMFDLALLAAYLRFGLPLSDFVVLRLVADQGSAGRTNTTTDRGTRAWMTHGSTDNRTRTSTQHAAGESTFFARSQRLPLHPKIRNRTASAIPLEPIKLLRITILRSGKAGNLAYSVSCCCFICSICWR
jgi:hypothetical protein